MTITRVKGATDQNTNGASSEALAFTGSVTALNMVTFTLESYSDANDPILVGDITKTAGTCTLGAFSLDVSTNLNTSGSNYLRTAIFSALVTGTGTCTLQVGGASAGSVWGAQSIDEWNSTVGFDASRLEDSETGTATSASATTAAGTSAGAALFLGAVSISNSAVETITEDGAFTLLVEQESGAASVAGSCIYQIVAGGTTDAASWTLELSRLYTASLAVYKEVGGAAPKVPYRSIYPGVLAQP